MSAPHTTRAHARLAPSAAHRWIECPGSIAACEGIPSTSSRFADEGTAAHTLNEFCFAELVDADAYLGDFVDIEAGAILSVKLVNRDLAGELFEIDDEMVEACQAYLDFVRPLCEGAEVEVEAKLDLSHIPGMDKGTGDFTAYNAATGALDIVDFKYGKGVKVFAKSNPQLMTYALGVVRRYHNRGVKTVRITIVQARLGHIDTWETDALTLLDFEADLTAAALATMEPGAPLVAGDWCRFCPAAPACPALAQKAYAAAQDAFSEPDADGLAEPARMSGEALALALHKAYLLKTWLIRMEAFAHDEAMAGRIPPGFKLVARRSTRRWINPDDAARRLQADFGVNPWGEPKVISPAVADKLLKKRKGEIAPLWEAVSSGTNLVPIEDERQPARPEVESVFEALT